MNKLQIFQYQDKQIRTIARDGEPWWVLKDVCEVLEISNPTMTASRLDSDEVTKFNLGGLSGETNVINESGLYNVILRSDKPQAKPFRKWVTGEVLPAIRKHGGYLTPDKIEEALLNPDTLIRLATDLKAERAKRRNLETENAQQKQLIAEYRPKASYYDVVLQTKDALSTSQIAKDYGKSAKWLNSLLHNLKVQYNQGGVWLLYQKYAEQGFTRSKTHTYCGDDGTQHSKLHTYWTQKGRLFIYDLLKSKGIFPLIEKDQKTTGISYREEIIPCQESD